MFPSGAPGLALVMLRVSVALTPFLLDRTPPELGMPWATIAWDVLGVLLIIGFLTPVASALSLALILVVATQPSGLSWAREIVLACNSGALTFLGPGAYSLDGRWFGRKLVKFPRQ
jgi:uncharacterized membrane protein YphA (DoxX/SURF4 family)